MTHNTNPAIEQNIILCGTSFIIRQPSAGKTITKWGADRFKHTITIKANGISKRFSFYGSENDWKNNNHRLTAEDLVDALSCIIDDAIAGTLDCEEFFAEYGYENPCEGLKAYKGCENTFRKLDDLGIVIEDLYAMSNELREQEA